MIPFRYTVMIVALLLTVHLSLAQGNLISQANPETIRPVRSLVQHTDAITAIDFSADSRILASGAADKQVLLWEVATGRILNTLTAHRDIISAVEFSADGAYLATASIDGKIYLWDTRTYAEPTLLESPSYAIFTLSFSPDSRILASAGASGEIFFWDVTTQALDSTLEAHKSTILALTFSNDGSQIVSAGDDGMVHLWDVTTGAEVSLLASSDEITSSLAFNPVNYQIAASGNAVRIWTRVLLERRLEEAIFPIQAVAFSPDGSQLASAACGDNNRQLCIQGKVRFWSSESGDYLGSIVGHTNTIYKVLYSPDGTMLATASANEIMLWAVGG